MNILDNVKDFLTKTSATTRAIVNRVSVNDPVWTKKDYEEMAEAGYKLNGWVYAAVDAIAKSAKGIPYKLERVASNGETRQVEDHEILDLLSRPNNEQGQGEFIESVISYWMISGNSYIERVPTDGEPRELHTLRPDRMTVVPNKKNRIGGYEYKVNGNTVKFDAEDILHLKLFNPTDDWYGMSPLESVARTVDQHNAATKWNTALLQNFGKVSGAFISEGRLNDKQFDRLKEELRDEYGGDGEAGKLALLEGSLDFKKLMMNPTDLDWLEGMKEAGKLIHGAYGVPGEITGIGKGATYENRREAKKALYTETVLPLVDHFVDELNNWLTPQFSENLRITYDRQDIPALREEQEKVWTRINEADWLTINEKRQETGYDEVEGGDVILAPASEMPITSPDITEGNEEGETSGEGGKETKSYIPAFDLESEEAKTQHWKAVDRRQQAWEGQVTKKVSERMEEETQAVIDAIKQAPGRDSIKGAALAAVSQQKWQKFLQAIYKGIVEDFGEQTLEGLKAAHPNYEKKDEVFGSYAQQVDGFIESTTANKVKQINETTRDNIRTEIQKGLDENKSVDEIAENIRDKRLEQTIPNRAFTIARTETLTASRYGNRMAAVSSNVVKKHQWVSSRDARVRDSHKAVDGESVPLNKRYSNGLMYPGDPSGSASQIINCRCTEIFETKYSE